VKTATKEEMTRCGTDWSEMQEKGGSKWWLHCLEHVGAAERNCEECGYAELKVRYLLNTVCTN
jgi:hypothetical protein